MSKDYYHILGIEKNADAEQVKKAYRKKAKLLHPDTNKDNNTDLDFQLLNEAYMVLSNPQERLQYDNGRELPVYTQEEVIEILREREIKNQDGSIFQYQSRNVYPETNYRANLSTVRLINLVILCIALLFIADVSFQRAPQTTRITETYDLYNDTRNLNDIGKTMMIAPDIRFAIPAEDFMLFSNNTFSFQRSLIFGKLTMVSVGSRNTDYIVKQRGFIMGLSILVLIVSLLGLSPLLTPERKFNAAIIGGFLCALLFVSLLSF